MICENCITNFPVVSDPICYRCGHSLIHPAKVCGNCLSPDFNLNQIRAPYYYHEPVSKIIHKMKYEGFFALAKPLAQLLVRSWPIWDNEPDVIFPIPLHPHRQKKRGFNQSSLLASHLSQQLKIPVNLKDFKRVKNTAPQVGLSPLERQNNVRDAFYTNPGTTSNKKILLVDDVFTTGATMIAAAKRLLLDGAAQVSAYCLARTI